MKNLLFTTAALVGLWGCTAKSPASAQKESGQAAVANNTPAAAPALGEKAYYGEKIDEEGAIDCKELPDKMGNAAELPAKVKGEIVDVCQAEGCWLRMDMGDGTTMRVDFNGHAFFVPKDIAGKTVIAEGKAVMDTVDVESLKDYAKDANKPQAEIDQIKDPQVELSFVAKGIIVK